MIQPNLEKFIKIFHEKICGNSQAIVKIDYDYFLDKEAGIATFTMETPYVGTEFSDGKDLQEFLNFCKSLQIFPNINLVKDGEITTKVEERDFPWFRASTHFWQKREEPYFTKYTECNLELYPFFSGF